MVSGANSAAGCVLLRKCHSTERVGEHLRLLPLRVSWLVAAFALFACAERADITLVPRQRGGDSQDGSVSRSARDGAPNVAGRGDAAASEAHAASDSAPMLLDGSDAMALGTETLDSGAPVPVRGSVVAPEHWRQLTSAEDPFDDRPPLVSCMSVAVMAETLGGEPVLDVDTGGCSYVTALQPTLREIATGEVIQVRVWHFELTAPEPAEAHVALVIDGLHVVDERVMIPQPGGLMTAKLRVTRTIAAGAPAYFHLHNHGTNNWALVEVSAGP